MAKKLCFPTPDGNRELQHIHIFFFFIIHGNILKLKKSLWLCLFDVSIISCENACKGLFFFLVHDDLLSLPTQCLLHADYKGLKNVHWNASFPEAACCLCWEKTRNHTPEDASWREDGSFSPGAAAWGDKMQLCQRPAMAGSRGRWMHLGMFMTDGIWGRPHKA